MYCVGFTCRRAYGHCSARMANVSMRANCIIHKRSHCECQHRRNPGTRLGQRERSRAGGEWSHSASAIGPMSIVSASIRHCAMTRKSINSRLYKYIWHFVAATSAHRHTQSNAVVSYVCDYCVPVQLCCRNSQPSTVHFAHESAKIGQCIRSPLPPSPSSSLCETTKTHSNPIVLIRYIPCICAWYAQPAQ